MASDVSGALAAIAATLNDQKLDEWDTTRVREIVAGSLAEGQLLTVDDGGGLHDSSGIRVGIVRRTPSGEWITERQNVEADRSDAVVPAARPQPDSS